MYITELFEAQDPSSILVIYPGRFQPWHKGHRMVYDYLTRVYGRDNVFVSTSNKVDPPRSPFSFNEKQQFMHLTGVSADRIVETRDPYRALELVQNYNPKTTRLVLAVSEKDMEEDPRFKFGTKKDGTPAYLQPMPGSVNDMQPFETHGYIMTVPTFEFSVLGQPMRSATEVRAQFADADEDTQRAIVKDLFGAYDRHIHDIMKQRLAQPISESVAIGTKLNLVKNYGNFETLVGVVKDVTPSGKLKIQITQAEPESGKKGAVRVGDVLTMASNYIKNTIAENFADGKNPQDKGDSKRHGINTKASVSSLRKTAKQGGRKGQLAHWLANMKAGQAKAKNEDVAEGHNDEDLADQVYAEFERMYPNLARRADDRVVHNAIMDVLNYGGDNNPGALAGDVARAVKQQMSQGGLNEFAPTGSNGGEEDPYSRPDPKHYSRSIDFFGKFEADHFDREDMNDVTGEFKGYWDYDGKLKQIAYFKFDNSKQTGSDDPGMGWYYEPESAHRSDSTDSDSAINNSEQRKQQELGMIDAFFKSGQKAKPGSQIYSLMKRHGVAEAKAVKQRLDAKCWKGKHKEGTKVKGGVRVNNCVPNESVAEGDMKPTQAAGAEKPGAVAMLEKVLLKAKQRSIKLNYDNIDKMMQLICNKHNLTGDKLHDDFVKKHNMIPDNWIKKQGVAETINPAIRNKRFAHTQVIGDYTYKASVEWFQGSPLLWIKAYDGDKQIGEVLFEIIIRSPEGKRDPSADYIESGGTEVEPEYRNKGVASTMYAYAKMLGNDIAPSYSQTSQGKAMWAAWEKAGDAKHLVGTAAESTVKEGDENPYRTPSPAEAARISHQTRTKLNPVRSQFVWKKPNQIGGSFTEQELVAKGFKKSQYNSWGGTQHMWDQLISVKEDAAGVGVIAKNKKMATDPRYSMSMTADVKPSTPAKNMKALRLI